MKSATSENVNVIYLGNGIMIPAEQPNVFMLEMSPYIFALDVDIVTYCVCVFFLYRKYRRAIVEFPAESGDNVLHGGPEQRGGNVQQ